MISPVTQESIASYFGILVKVIVRMEHCSLIRYHDRELVVGTEDLQLCRATQRVA
jgi:hypothetical protein